MDSWSTQLNSQIDEKLIGVNEKDIRFFRIDEFKRNVSRIDAFSSSCHECQQQKQYIQEAVDSIDKAIKNVGSKRRDYDKLISKLSKHMQKEHGFYAPYYFTYMYSFLGIVAGGLIGYLVMNLNPEYQLELFCLGFAIGLLPPYVVGSVKDKKIRRQKKLM
ncbi:hypothetical protein [uncultured Draconibacterium sp.]|uniref:hypothetical protein n=1 Tax=uncultured Draconibacterium sp. TaxID=1573823 RepID=UPI00321629AA